MKKLLSKVAHNRLKTFFQYYQLTQHQPKSYILFHKNYFLHNLNVITLFVVVTWFNVNFLVVVILLLSIHQAIYKAVVRQSSKRLFSLVFSKIERGLENVASLTVYVEIWTKMTYCTLFFQRKTKENKTFAMAKHAEVSLNSHFLIRNLKQIVIKLFSI